MNRSIQQCNTKPRKPAQSTTAEHTWAGGIGNECHQIQDTLPRSHTNERVTIPALQPSERYDVRLASRPSVCLYHVSSRDGAATMPYLRHQDPYHSPPYPRRQRVRGKDHLFPPKHRDIRAMSAPSFFSQLPAGTSCLGFSQRVVVLFRSLFVPELIISLASTWDTTRSYAFGTDAVMRTNSNLYSVIFASFSK